MADDRRYAVAYGVDPDCLGVMPEPSSSLSKAEALRRVISICNGRIDALRDSRRRAARALARLQRGGE